MRRTSAFEIGKTGNAFASEIALPLHGPNDLADDLRQPSQGMCLGKRNVIGRRFQETAAIADQKLQMKFQRPVGKAARPDTHPTMRPDVQLPFHARLKLTVGPLFDKGQITKRRQLGVQLEQASGPASPGDSSHCRASRL
jgi:hypothetical protein